MVRRGSAVVTLAVASVLLSGVRSGGQDLVSGKFYRYEIVGRSGLGDVTGILATGPSINSGGKIAFAGQSSGLNALYVSDLGVAIPRRITTQNTFSFLRGIMINNAEHVIALDQASAPEPSGLRKQYLRDYNTTPPGPYPTPTMIAGAIDPFLQRFSGASVRGGAQQ